MFAKNHKKKEERYHIMRNVQRYFGHGYFVRRTGMSTGAFKQKNVRRTGTSSGHKRVKQNVVAIFSSQELIIVKCRLYIC